MREFMEELTARKAILIFLFSIGFEIWTGLVFGTDVFLQLTVLIASLAGLFGFLTVILLAISTRGHRHRVITNPEKYKLAKITFVYAVLFILVVILSLAIMIWINPEGR
jgi:hypothetical protein